MMATNDFTHAAAPALGMVPAAASYYGEKNMSNKLDTNITLSGHFSPRDTSATQLKMWQEGRQRLNENKLLFQQQDSINRTAKYLNPTTSVMLLGTPTTATSLLGSTTASCEKEQLQRYTTTSNDDDGKTVSVNDTKWNDPEWQEFLMTSLDQGHVEIVLSELNQVSHQLAMSSKESTYNVHSIQHQCKETLERIQAAVSDESNTEIEQDLALLKSQLMAIRQQQAQREKDAKWKEARERFEQNKRIFDDAIQRNKNLQQLSSTFPAHRSFK